MFLKLKLFIQSTFLYTIYLFFVRNYRRAKKNIKKVWRKRTDPIYRYYVLKVLYPRIYKKYSRLPVDEKKVVFVEIRLPNLTNSYKVLYDELYQNYDFDIHCHFLRNTYVNRTQYRRRCKAFIKDIATAKYVFMDEATNIMGNFEMREETVVTQLWHGCGAFKKFGYSTADAIFGATREEMDKYPFNRNYTNVTVSSPEVIWAYEEAMNYTRESGVVKALGSSRTDVFYDEDFIKASYDALYEIMPEAKGKKVILYAPTFRGNSLRNSYMRNTLDLDALYDNLHEDYAFVMKLHPLTAKAFKLTEEQQEKYRGFLYDVSHSANIDTALCAADIVISDYSSLIFEYSLLERPMMFYAYDLEKYENDRSFYFDYRSFVPGEIVEDTEGIINEVKRLETEFDKQRVINFKNDFMSACDGNSTKRICDYIFNN